MERSLRVVLIKPSKYGLDGYVERFWRGFMPNATLSHIAGLTPNQVNGTEISVIKIDEYVHTETSYLSLLRPKKGERVLVALVGVQSHQLHRAADLAALAVNNGCMAVIGGPHPMTCDTSMLQGHGVSFCLAEAELAWLPILSDAADGKLAPIYGQHQRWAKNLDLSPVLVPRRKQDRRYLGDMQGIYPARGCPKVCNFCSVIKIAGRQVRSQPIETTIQSLLAAQAAGVKLIMFTSDNFNKYGEVADLLEAMIAAGVRTPFMCQCDTDLVEQPELVALMERAGCFQIFLGVESFDRRALQAVHKGHNRPAKYGEIVRLLAEHGIGAHFSNIIGFPTDTEDGIRDQVEQLKEIEPLRASFYLFMPIPGTEWYGEFLPQGRITELNLDRFDGSCPVWRHPNMTGQQWLDMFKYCHKKFYSVRQVARTVAAMRQGHPNLARQVKQVMWYAVFARLMAWQGQNPMSGGVWRVKADHVSQYLPLRQSFFGLGDRFSLPSNLELSEADQALNRQVKRSTV